MTLAAASFDALQLSAGISRASESGAAHAEVHAFAYLGCLLSVYEERSPDDWGYKFHATPAGAPYAPALDNALQLLRAHGLLNFDRQALSLSETGLSDLESLRAHETNRPRGRYLDSATATAVLMPLPLVTSALSREPQMERILGAPESRDLLDPAGVETVKAHFRVISETFAAEKISDSDLTLPAVIWLTALSGQESDD